jgi:hypothetical protein
MKRIPTIALLTIASLGTATGAIAQDRAVKANIPFNFTVGDTWMPAGEYVISSPQREILQVRNVDDRSKIATIVDSESYNESTSGGKLVFDKYGNQYFLRHVLCPTVASLNVDLAQGKAEKKAHSRSLEANLHNSEETLVAVR